MASKQILAQIGVFALLGLNVGAYYVFWPHRESDAKGDTKPMSTERGVAQLRIEKKDKPAPPKVVPALVMNQTAPLPIANPPVNPPQAKDPDDSVIKLLQHIEKEAGTPITLPMPMTPNDADNGGLPGLPIEEKKPRVAMAAKGDSGIVGVSAVTPKAAPSSWLMNMEEVGPQTQLTAKLRSPALEFTILCDRVEMKGGTVLALGKVTFAGAGLKGQCQRLTLPRHAAQLLFEEQVNLTQDAKLGANLRGERILWELNAPAVEPQPQVLPIEPLPSSTFPTFPLIPGLAK